MFSTSNRRSDYETLVTTYQVDVSDIESAFSRHVLVIWLLIPAIVAFGSLSVSGHQVTSVTCENGFSWWIFILLFFVTLYHFRVENTLWHSIFGFLTRPEVTIVHHYNLPTDVRRVLRMLSLVEIIHLATALMFPFVAYQCSPRTSIWMDSWEHTSIPFMIYIAKVVEAIGFWGISAICIALSFLGQFGHAFWTISRPFMNRQQLCVVMSKVRPTKQNHIDDATEMRTSSGLHDNKLKVPVNTNPMDDVASRKIEFENVRAKLAGEQFAVWSAGAQCCMLPSVAALCDNLSDGRRWKLDFRQMSSLTEGYQPQEESSFGPKEIIDRSEFMSVYAHSVQRFWSSLFFHILFGPLMALYLQVTFFGLAFSVLSVEAKVKLLVAILASLITLLYRSWMQVGLMVRCCSMVLFTLFIFAWIVLCVLKLFFAFYCSSHVWSSTYGCVTDYPT